MLELGVCYYPEQWPREKWDEDARRMGGPPQRTQPNRVYATLEQALTRFRFMPPQVPGNLYIADFIARRSLKRAPMPDGSAQPRPTDPAAGLPGLMIPTGGGS